MKSVLIVFIVLSSFSMARASELRSFTISHAFKKNVHPCTISKNDDSNDKDVYYFSIDDNYIHSSIPDHSVLSLYSRRLFLPYLMYDLFKSKEPLTIALNNVESNMRFYTNTLYKIKMNENDITVAKWNAIGTKLCAFVPQFLISILMIYKIQYPYLGYTHPADSWE